MKSRIQGLETLAKKMASYQKLLQHWLHPTRNPGERKPIVGLPEAYSRWVPGGKFLMGSLITKVGRFTNGGPRRWVWLQQSYRMIMP